MMVEMYIHIIVHMKRLTEHNFWTDKQTKKLVNLIVKKFVLLTKPGCHSCEAVRTYLTDKAADFEEWNVESKIIIDRLMQDPKFNQKFCDIDECYSNLPAIRMADTGDYYFGEDLVSFKRFYALDKLLELNEK